MRARTEAVDNMLGNIARSLHLLSRIVTIEWLSVDHAWITRAAAAYKECQIQFAGGRIGFAFL